VWKNPHPDKNVLSIDYVSAMTDVTPFCVAITVEAAAKENPAEPPVEETPEARPPEESLPGSP